MKEEFSTILCVTHSSRPFLESRCTTNGLIQRFANRELDKNLPPASTLPSFESSVPYDGAVTFWAVDKENGYKLRALHKYAPSYKVQFATFSGDRLLVFGSDRLEVFDINFNLVKSIEDPWVVGGHTVFEDGSGHAWVTSAVTNAAMRIDLETGQVVERLRMPEKYGKGYPIGDEFDGSSSYIPTDLQPTHINCAFPVDGGVLVTLLIQGVVGFFDEDRNYREIVSGFVGCHGGRVDPDTNELFLADSPGGHVWFFDRENGKISGRLDFQSKWLHDADKLDDGVFVGGMGDTNEIKVVSRKTGEVLFQEECSRFGQSVMFVNACKVGAAWQEALESSSANGDVKAEPSSLELGSNIFRDALLPSVIRNVIGAKVSGRYSVRLDRKLKYETILEEPQVKLPPGKYQFGGNIICYKSGVTLGLLNVDTNTWVSQLNFDSVNHSLKEIFTTDTTANIKLVLSAYNPFGAKEVMVDIVDISLNMADPIDEDATQHLRYDIEPERIIEDLRSTIESIDAPVAKLVMKYEKRLRESKYFNK